MKLIEYQRLVELWAVYCSEIERRPEACWKMGYIFIWKWFKIIGLMNEGLYIALKLIEYHRLVECWDVYCSEIDIRAEDCCVVLWFLNNRLLIKYIIIWECWTDYLVFLQIKDPIYLYTLRCCWCRCVTTLVADSYCEAFAHNHLICLWYSDY